MSVLLLMFANHWTSPDMYLIIRANVTDEKYFNPKIAVDFELPPSTLSLIIESRKEILKNYEKYCNFWTTY